MAFNTSRTSWGVACTIDTSTAAGNIVVGKGTMIPVSAIVCGGAATTDIVTVTDFAGNKLWQGCALVGQSDKITFTPPANVDGLKVGIAGATTGWCSIYYAQ